MDLKKIRPHVLGTQPKQSEADELARLTLDSNQLGQSYTKMPSRQDPRRKRERTSSNKSGQRSPQIVKGARLPPTENESARNLMDSSSNRQSEHNISQLLRSQFELEEPHRRNNKKNKKPSSRDNTPTDEGQIDDRIEIVDFGAGSPQYSKKPESFDILPRRASKRHTGNLQNHLAPSKDRDHLPEIAPVVDVDLEQLQHEQTQINDELRMLKEVQKTRKERLQLIKEQSINQMEQELKDLKKIDKKKRQVPRIGTQSKIFSESKQNSFNDGKDRPASSRITTPDQNKDLSLIHAIDERKKKTKIKAKKRISDLHNALMAPITNFGYMTAYNPRTKENDSSRSSMSSANPLGDIGSIEGEVPVDVEQELSKRMQKEKELSEDDDDDCLDASTPSPKKRKNRPLHMKMSDDSSDSQSLVSRKRGRASSQMSGRPRKMKDGDNKLRDVRSNMINASFGPMPPDTTPQTDEKDDRKRKRRGSQSHKNSDLNVDQIMKNMSPDEKKVTRKGSKDKDDSGIKSKLSYKRTFGQSINDDVLQTDALPRIDESKIKAKDKMKVERMRARKNKKTWMLYPEDQQKVYWDLFITVILLISCILTPYNIAFGEVKEPLGWTIINFTIDAMFLIDILIIFNSAYYDDEFIIVEDRKQIAQEYISSWFIIDLLAIVPFDYIFVSDNYQEIVRIARIGKISKLIKMTRLLRILKIVKQRSQLLKYLNEILKIGLGLERLLFFTLIFFLMCHILTCIWVIAAQFSQEEVENEEAAAAVDEEAQMRRLLNSTAPAEDSNRLFHTSWFDEFDHLQKGSAYITSFYFTITTITTVGYGDISGTNTLERSVSILIMIIGVISFSFTTGSLSSILQNYDQANAKLQERISVLNRIYKDYYLPLDLYQRLRQAVKYDFNKDKNDINQFVMDLPHKLKLEISLYIHEQTYKKIDIFKGRSSAFIAWICPLLKPLPFPENQYIYFEGDDITNIYFLIRGKAGFVLPKYQNTAFIDINVGSHFGIIDIVGSILQAKFDLENWILHKDVLQRQFTIMALKESEVMCLSIQDLNRMKQEFLEAYQKLFGDAYNRLRRSLTLKLKAMKICAEREESSQISQKSDDGSVEFDVNQQAPQSLSNEISLTQEERRQIKAHEIDYQIQAIQLNKIDEQSLEESSQGKTPTPIKSNRGQEGLNSSKRELEDEPPSGPTKPLLPTPGDSKVSEESGANDFFADAQKAYNQENNSFKQAVKRRRSMHYNSRQDLNRDVDSQLIKQDANSPGLKKLAKTDDELSKSLTGLQAKKSRLQQDFDIHNLKIIQKAKEDHIVELESKEIIKQVTALQKGLSFGFSPDSKPQAPPSTSQGSFGSYNFMRNRASPPKEDQIPVGEGIAPVAAGGLGEVTSLLSQILKKVETLEETQKQNVKQMKSHMLDLEKKVELNMLKPTKKKSKTHADSSAPRRDSSFKQEKNRSSPSKEEPIEPKRYGSELLVDTPKVKDRSPAKTHKADLASHGSPNKDLRKSKSRKQSCKYGNPSELNLQMSNDGSKIENIFGELSTKKNGHPHPKMSSNFEDKHVEKLFKESMVGRKNSKAGVAGAVYESPNSQTRMKDFVGFLNSKSSGHSSPRPQDKDKH